jgi:hypothetical protein
VIVFTDGLLEIRVDGKPYFGGDIYKYRRAPAALKLDPGRHVIDLRLIRDVRALGGTGEPRIEAAIEFNETFGQLAVDADSLVTAEVVEGRLASPLASVHVRNDLGASAEVLWIKALGVGAFSNPIMILEFPLICSGLSSSSCTYR